jgi:hypothetical protein
MLFSVGARALAGGGAGVVVAVVVAALDRSLFGA